MSLGLGLGLDKNNFISTGGFDSDYQAVLDYATTQGYTLPSSAQQDLQNQLVLDLKADGIWAKLDCFSVFATDGDSDFALIDWIRLITQTAVNSPTFTTNQGFQGDGSSAYINTNFLINSGANRTQNSAHKAYYFDANTNTGFSGARDLSSFEDIIRHNGSLQRINAGFVSSSSNTWTNTEFIISNRSSGTAAQIYRNGTLSSEDTSYNSVPLVALDDYILATNENGTAGLHSSQGVLIYSQGSSVSADAADFNTAIQAYINAI